MIKIGSLYKTYTNDYIIILGIVSKMRSGSEHNNLYNIFGYRNSEQVRAWWITENCECLFESKE